MYDRVRVSDEIRLIFLTWQIEYLIDPDNSKPRLLKLCFVFLQSSSYRGSTVIIFLCINNCPYLCFQPGIDLSAGSWLTGLEKHPVAGLENIWS